MKGHLSWYAAKLHVEEERREGGTVENHWCEKLRLTVMLATNADGRKLPSLLIFKRKTLPKSEAFLKDVIVRAQEKGWMMDELMLERLKIVWGCRPRAFLNHPSMLVLDAFKGHLTDSVKNQLRKMNTELVVIPVGMTSVLQPMDITIKQASPLKTG